jgi:hypothetical protein
MRTATILALSLLIITAASSAHARPLKFGETLGVPAHVRQVKTDAYRICSHYVAIVTDSSRKTLSVQQFIILMYCIDQMEKYRPQ